MTGTEIAYALPWIAAGAALGAVYFLLLARSVAAIGDGAGWQRHLGLLGLRLGIAAAGLALAATQGALALLCTLAGVLVARAVAFRLVRER